MRYTAYAGTYLYRGTMGAPGASAPITLHKYIVRGRVVDEEGRGVRGAALRVDGEMVFSDSSGQFFVRKRRATRYKLQVLPDQFLVPERYEVVAAPAEVNAAPDELAKDVTVVVRRLAHPAR
ncbi:MAG: carboxypeptidase-like regulatory domain-containing protein [Acidobacteriia bacterium]|nr:carboxypeptidase-like regulatory domain-containing protein [Terriglobia bacterium]